MPGDNFQTEPDTKTDLKGSPNNPARDPKVLSKADKSEVGYIALQDALILIGIAWLIVLFTYFSLRHFNI